MERSEEAAPGSRHLGWIRWLLIGVGLGVFACWLIWFAGEQSDRAQRLAGSTFDFADREIAQAQLLYLGAGAVFAIVVLVSRRRATRDQTGLLVGAALPPLGLLLFLWDRMGRRWYRLRFPVGWLSPSTVPLKQRLPLP